MLELVLVLMLVLVLLLALVSAILRATRCNHCSSWLLLELATTAMATVTRALSEHLRQVWSEKTARRGAAVIEFVRSLGARTPIRESVPRPLPTQAVAATTISFPSSPPQQLLLSAEPAAPVLVPAPRVP